MPLTDAKVRTAKPAEKTYKLYDGMGLYLEINPSGGKWWRFKYSFDGKEKRLSLGTYPEVPLASSKNQVSGVVITGARERRDAARQLLAEGIDPGEHRKAMSRAKEKWAANSFEAVTREWLVKFAARLKPSSVERKLKLFEKDIFPWIGSKPIAALTAPEVLSVLRRIEDRGAGEIAARAKMYCGQAFRYAVATGRAERDPTQDLREALAPRSTTHHAALTDPKAVGGLLRAIDAYEGYFVTKCALRLAPLVFVRPGELRNAQWKEFDLDAAEWIVPAERMKMRQPHLVPLSEQALEIIQELHPKTKFSSYLFPRRSVNANQTPRQRLEQRCRRASTATEVDRIKLHSRSPDPVDRSAQMQRPEIAELFHGLVETLSITVEQGRDLSYVERWRHDIGIGESFGFPGERVNDHFFGLG